MGRRGRGALKPPPPPKQPVGRPSLKTPPELEAALWELVPLIRKCYRRILRSKDAEAMRHQVNVGAKVLDLLLRVKNEGADEGEKKKDDKLNVKLVGDWRPVAAAK